jgi:hypothetical protein
VTPLKGWQEEGGYARVVMAREDDTIRPVAHVRVRPRRCRRSPNSSGKRESARTRQRTPARTGRKRAHRSGYILTSSYAGIRRQQ